MASISVDDIKSLRAPGKLAPADFKTICVVLDCLAASEKLLPNMDLYAARIAENAPKATAEQINAIQTQLGAQKWELAKVFFEKKGAAAKIASPVVAPAASVAAAVVKSAVPKASPTVKATPQQDSQPEGIELRVHRIEAVLVDVKDLLVSLHEKFNTMASGLAPMDDRLENISDAVADIHKVVAYDLSQNFGVPMQAVMDAGNDAFEYAEPAVAFARGVGDEDTQEPGAASGEG